MFCPQSGAGPDLVSASLSLSVSLLDEPLHGSLMTDGAFPLQRAAVQAPPPPA